MKNHGNLEDLDEVQKREGNLQAEHSFPEKAGDLLDGDDHYHEKTDALDTAAAEDLAASAGLKLTSNVLELTTSTEPEQAAPAEKILAESLGMVK